MTALLVLLIVVAAGVTGVAGGRRRPLAGNAHRGGGRRGRDRDRPRAGSGRRILLPFTGTSISRRSLEAAIRLARAEDAIIMPAYLANVPRHLPIDAPLSAQCLQAMPLLEAIEQKAIAAGIAVDARVGRGRSYRDALRHVIAAEPVDRIIVSASANPRAGLSAQDLQWLLSRVPSEVLILRPGQADDRTVTAAGIAGHF